MFPDAAHICLVQIQTETIPDNRTQTRPIFAVVTLLRRDILMRAAVGQLKRRAACKDAGAPVRLFGISEL
jgi:hypothetical protein